MEDIFNFIKEHKVIAIVRGISSENIRSLAEAILVGGIRCIEVTFDQSSEDGRLETLRSVSFLREHLGEQMRIGAGTVMSKEQVLSAKEAGAEYIVSPNVDRDVIEETKKLGLLSMPGAFTPSEVADAWKYGADIVKLFPAALMGTAYIKALRAPLKHIPLSAVGGISPDNCRSFLEAGCTGIGVGGNLVSPQLVSEGRFEEITATATAYTKALMNS